MVEHRSQELQAQVAEAILHLPRALIRPDGPTSLSTSTGPCTRRMTAHRTDTGSGRRTNLVQGEP